MSTFNAAYQTLRPRYRNYLRIPDNLPLSRGTKGVQSPFGGFRGPGLSAAFDPAYSLLRKHEGYYVNDPEDLGKETYAGVARAIHPVWAGWAILDKYKRKVGRPLLTNEVVPGMEEAVEQFYRSRWSLSRAGEIVSQDVANIYFDFYILAARAVATMQEVLRSMGQNVDVDNNIGSQTISAINAVNPEKLYQKYKSARIEYHKDRVASGAVSAKFLPGWLKRTMDFPDLLSPLPIAGMAAAGVTVFFIMHKPARDWLTSLLWRERGRQAA